MKNILSILLLLSVSLLFDSYSYPNISSEEKKYISLKTSGQYREAIDHLKQWTPTLNEPHKIEINVFRLYECIQFIELVPPALEALDKIYSSKALLQYPFIKDRINIFRNLLLLKQGDLFASNKIVSSLSYWDLHVMGPFRNSSIQDFQLPYEAERFFEPDQFCQGKYHSVFWFRAKSDRTGVINVNDLFAETADSFYYFHRNFSISKEGRYFIILGKTGYSDVWLDGKRIFTNRQKHAFMQDQYFIEVRLGKGKHRLLLKAGDSDDGVKVSIRLAGWNGKSVSVSELDMRNLNAGKSRLVRQGLFPSLQKLKLSPKPDSEWRFNIGYLYMASRLGISEKSQAVGYFSEIPRSNPYYSLACYYIGKAEQIIERKDEYFQQSISVNPKNIESLFELSRIRISANFLFEAYPLIEKTRNANKSSPLYHVLLIDLMEKRGWYHEALHQCKELRKGEHPSIGSYREALIRQAQGRYNQAIPLLNQLAAVDQYNERYMISLARCFEGSGRYDDAEKILHRSAIIFPNHVFLKLMLAKMIGNRFGPSRALPYLSAAHRISPWNKNVLRELGMAYNQMGNRKLGIYYLSLAQKHDPDNYDLKRLLKIIRKEGDRIEPYLTTRDKDSLAQESNKYRKEEAIILLDEKAFSVNADGSYEEHVRYIYRVNDRDAVKNFSNHYIVYEPTYEKIENVRCVLTQGGRKIDIQDFYEESLSDPESRLYYKLKAIVIPVTSLETGGIVEISYIRINQGAHEFKNYYGEKITIGSRYRTLHTNIVLLHDRSKRIYWHLKGASRSDLKVYTRSHHIVYRLKKINMPPYKKEHAMPHFSTILPTLYFTSLKDWSEFHSWYWSLVKDRIRVTDNMKALVLKTVNPGDSPLQKVEKIYFLVTDLVRYVGFEFGISGIQPRSTDETFHSRMGDCKDVSLLLVALLQEAGIDAKLALIRTRNKGKPDLTVPYAGEFNHAICYINIGSGFYIDGTVDNSGIRELPADDHNVIALLIDEKGFRLSRTGGDFYHPSLIEVNNDIVVGNDGTVAVKRTLIKHGDTAPEARYSLTDPEKRMRSLHEYWNSSYPGSHVSNIRIYSMKRDAPVKYEYQVAIPEYCYTGEREIIFNPTVTISHYYSRYTPTAKRIFPLVLSDQWTIRETTRYLIPDEYHAYYIPKSEQFDHEKFDARFTYSRKDKHIILKTHIRFKTYRIEIEDYSAFRRFTRFVNRKELERVVLYKNTEKK